jgi:2-polyprenyl-3-methyl-5-hydroxy-6-metoxy-1,4-benzoquinol methylase
MTAQYDSYFYRQNQSASLASAEVIGPILVELINPSSVVDIGCGIGEWLSVFEALGVKDVLGLDGGIGTTANLVIDRSKFKYVSLTETIVLERKFDLLLCLEVAEHLPEWRALSFVKDLCQLSPVIAFSAAIPFQGGTGHLNEQWQSYWGDMFSRFGYKPVDSIRPRIWDRRDSHLGTYRT